MTEIRAVVSAHILGLIDGFYNGFDAAAEQINARWGRGGSKGTISKKVAGHLDWTIADVIALEDGAKRYPITQMLARRLERAAPASNLTTIDHAANIAREAGEAVCTLLSATQEAGAGNIAQAIKELQDVENAARAARERLERITP